MMADVIEHACHIRVLFDGYLLGTSVHFSEAPDLYTAHFSVLSSEGLLQVKT